MVVKIKIDFDKITLILFFAFLLYIAPGFVLDHKLAHDFPYGYFASDSFQHQVRAEAIKDAGNFRYEAEYISLGFKGAVGRYPPVIYHIAVIFSYAAGTEVYDSIYFIVFFFAIMGAIAMYFIIRNFSRNVAIISLPLSMIAFSQPASIGFLWGHWPSLLSQVFLIAFAWCVMRIDLKKSFILMVVILSSIALTHTSEAVFGLIFLGLFLIVKLVSRNIGKSEIINIATAFLTAFLISAYYLVIFKNTWAIAQPWSFGIEPVWNGNPGFYIANFGILLAFMASGFFFSLLKLKEIHASLVFASAMLLSGFLNYAGFSVRSFQIRFFWPIYLSVFFGFGIYMLFKFAIKKWSIAYSFALFIIIVLLLLGFPAIPLVPHYVSLPSNEGLMDVYHWSAFKWISSNTEEDSKIYFLYGDIYSQDALLRNSKRLHYQVVPEDFIKAIQERKVKRRYISELPGDSGGIIAVRKSLFSFEYPERNVPDENFYGPQDICSFNYIVVDKGTRQPVLAQYNLLIASELLKKKYVSKVFENDAIIILKNNNIGGDCIEERSF